MNIGCTNRQSMTRHPTSAIDRKRGGKCLVSSVEFCPVRGGGDDEEDDEEEGEGFRCSRSCPKG